MIGRFFLNDTVYLYNLKCEELQAPLPQKAYLTDMYYFDLKKFLKPTPLSTLYRLKKVSIIGGNKENP